MEDHNNNDHVVFDDYGRDGGYPSGAYPNMQDYNVNPDGNAGYPEYIKNRGDDSKYGAVPRFDTMSSYDQPQPAYGTHDPYNYGYDPRGYQTDPYAQEGYPAQAPYNPPYAPRAYSDYSESPAYGQEPRPYGADNYGYGDRYAQPAPQDYSSWQQPQQSDHYYYDNANYRTPYGQEQLYAQRNDRYMAPTYPEAVGQRNVVGDIAGGQPPYARQDEETYYDRYYEAGRMGAPVSEPAMPQFGLQDEGPYQVPRRPQMPPKTQDDQYYAATADRYAAPRVSPYDIPKPEYPNRSTAVPVPYSMGEEQSERETETGMSASALAQPLVSSSANTVSWVDTESEKAEFRRSDFFTAPQPQQTTSVLEPDFQAEPATFTLESPKPKQPSKPEPPTGFETAVFSIKDFNLQAETADAELQPSDTKRNDAFGTVLVQNDPFAAAESPMGSEIASFGTPQPQADAFGAPAQQRDPFAAAEPPMGSEFASFGTPQPQADAFGAPAQQRDPFAAAEPPMGSEFASFGAPQPQANAFGAPAPDKFREPTPIPQVDPFVPAPLQAESDFASFGVQPQADTLNHAPEQQSDAFATATPQTESNFASFGRQPQPDVFGVPVPQDGVFANATEQPENVASGLEPDGFGDFGKAFSEKTDPVPGSNAFGDDMVINTYDTRQPSPQPDPFAALMEDAQLSPTAAVAVGNPFTPMPLQQGDMFAPGLSQDPYMPIMPPQVAPFAQSGGFGQPTPDQVVAPPFQPQMETVAQAEPAMQELTDNIFESQVKLDDTPKPRMPMRDTEIFRIAEELSQAVLIKSHSRAFNENNLMPEGGRRLVEVEGISSEYHISEGGSTPYQMYRDIRFVLNEGTCCAMISDVPLAAYALARSICESADQDFEDEPVRVADIADGEKGQIMYIGSDSMLPEEMTCEEFLLYTQTGKAEIENEAAGTEKERLTVLLSQLGMSDLQETDLRELSYNKRIMLIALAATLNPKIVCIVINDPKFRVDAEEEMLARRIFALMNNRGKCSLIACSSAYLMAAVANRVAVIQHGQLECMVSYKQFVDENCLGIMSFNTENPAAFTTELETKYPSITALGKDSLVYLIRKKGAPEIDLESLIKDIIRLGADYNSIVMDEKSFVMACKEVLGKR